MLQWSTVSTCYVGCSSKHFTLTYPYNSPVMAVTILLSVLQKRRQRGRGEVVSEVTWRVRGGLQAHGDSRVHILHHHHAISTVQYDRFLKMNSWTRSCEPVSKALYTHKNISVLIRLCQFRVLSAVEVCEYSFSWTLVWTIKMFYSVLNTTNNNVSLGRGNAVTVFICMSMWITKFYSRKRHMSP